MDNTQKLKELAIVVKASNGIFAPIVAVCDRLDLREELIEKLENKLSDRVTFYHILLDKKQYHLRAALQETMGQLDGQKVAVIVKGLENLDRPVDMDERRGWSGERSGSDYEEFFTYLQHAREGIGRFPYPIVLWVTNQERIDLTWNAPDFYSWCKKTIVFS